MFGYSVMMARFSEKAEWILVAAFSILLLAVSYLRLYFGVDFTDEALYTAIPYRFVLGDKPYLDEWNLAQSAALLVYPFVRIFVWWNGTQGLVLFTRHLAFAFSVITAGAMYLSFRQRAGGPWLLLSICLGVVFVPYGLLGPGYNAVGRDLFALGLCLAWDPSRRARSSLWALGAGICHGWAAFAYPTLAAPAFVFLLFLFVTSERRVRVASEYVGAGFLAVAFLWGAFRVRPADFMGALNYVFAFGVNSHHGWDGNKLVRLLVEFWSQYKYKLGLLVFFTALAFSIRRKHLRATFTLLVLLPVVLFFSNRAAIGGSGVMGFLRYFGVLGIFFYVLGPQGALQRNLLWGVWLPSSVAGAMMGWSSNMSTEACAIPMVPAVVTTLFFITQFIPWKVGRLIPSVLVLTVVLYSRLGVYMDDPLSKLTERVASGPFLGLYTTPQKARYLMEISDALQKVQEGAETIMFQSHFPAGYLLTRLRPSASTVWGTCPLEMGRLCFDYYRAKINGRGLAVNIRNLFYYTERTDDSSLPENSPMVRMLHERHRLLVATPAFEIYETSPNAMSVSPQRDR